MMYYKIVNGQQIFSDCKVMQNQDGSWTSNPTAEMIAAAGWLEYIPPEVLPQPELEPDYNDVIEAVKRMLQTSAEELTDEQALEVAAIYPTWSSKIGEAVSIGERYWYDGDLYKVVQAHTVQDNWTPDITPAMFTKVSIEEFPAWVQPTGAQDAYMSGDKVTHNDLHWECTVDYNVYEPGVYGWTQLN